MNISNKITEVDLYDRWPRAYDALLNALQVNRLPNELVIMESSDWQDVYVTGAGRIAIPLSDWVQERWLVRETGHELGEYLDAQQAEWAQQRNCG